MKWLMLLLFALTLFLQYELWFAAGSLKTTRMHQLAIKKLKDQNLKLKHRNAVIAADVNDLKTGTQAIGEYARVDLGMVKQGEVLYRVVGGPGSD